MRIRTIKPDFWTDEKIGELSFATRLFFIALWNIADDSGNFANKPKQLKIQCLPYDTVDIAELLEELECMQLITKYSVNKLEYYHINNFLKHQKINRPSPPIHPLFSEHSVSTHETLNDNSLGKEGSKEGKGKEGKGNNNNNLSFDDCIELFLEHGLDKEQGKQFYNSMEKLHWLNKEGQPITDKIRYTLQTIKQVKNETTIRTTKRNTTNFAHKQPTVDERELTGAELRKLGKLSS
jgi:hypothetical protein